MDSPWSRATNTSGSSRRSRIPKSSRVERPCQTAGSFNFRFAYDRRNGYYLVTNARTNKAVDVQGGRTSPGTNVRMWVRNGAYAQRWSVVRDGGCYTLVSACNSLALDAKGGRSSNRTNIQCWRRNGSKAQKWMLINIA